MIGLAATFFLLWLVGFLGVRQGLREDNPWIAVALPLPLSLLTLLGTSMLLSQILPYRSAWIITIVAFVVAGMLLWRRRDRMPAWQPFGLSSPQWALLMTGLTGAYFYMHTLGLSAPEDDYWIHFPVIAMLERGFLPPPNPFLEGITLHGHFGRNYLLAILTTASGGDIMLATWTFNHLLQIGTFFLACGVGIRYGRSAAAGVLLPLLLFFGVSVGSRAGLVDTYDNNNLLVYAILLALMVLLLQVLERPTLGRYAFLALMTGFYSIVYETHMILFLGCVLWAPLVVWPLRSAELKRGLLLGLGSTVLSLLVASLLGGPIQDLTARLVGLRQQKPISQADAYQSQRVEISFPKKEFLQIKLGRDPYRRLSYVYEGKLFRDRLPPLDEGGYTFIFHPKVLVLHWLATYLGLPAGLYLAYRRHTAGVLLWLFAFFSYLVPGVVNFGPMHENEYFRWEFAAGFGFAGALALALGDLWVKAENKRWVKAVIVVVALLTMLGGERRVNQAAIMGQKASEPLSRRLSTPIYPAGWTWLTETKVLEIAPADVELCRWLKGRTNPSDVLVTNLEARKHWDMFRESTLVGMSGVRSVGHQSLPPPWMPDGIAPYFRTPNWTVFWQTLDARALPALGASWLYVDIEPKRLEQLKALPQLKLEKEIEAGDGRVRAALSIKSPKPKVVSSTPPQLVVDGVTLPEAELLQSEVAYPVELHLTNAGTEKVAWEGPLGLAQTPLGPEQSGLAVPPTELWVELELDPGQTVTVKHWLVPYLLAGDYNLQPYLGDPKHPLGEPRVVSYSFLDKAERVVIESSEILTHEGEDRQGRLTLKALAPGFRLEGPLRLGWRVWDEERQAYGTPYGFDGVQPLELQLATPPDRVVVNYQAKLPNSPRFRLDFFLVSRSGIEHRLDAE